MKMRKSNKTLKKVILTAIVSILILVIGIYLYNTYKNIEINNNEYQTQRIQSTIDVETVENTTEKSKTVADIFEQITESIVGISKLKNTGSSIFSKSNESELGLGTGILVTQNGYILSNEHVTGSKFSKCYVTLENGKVYDGIVKWSDTDLDLSIVKIEENNLKCMTLGDSNNIRVGENVYAIGNPIGFEFRRTITSGIISGKNRSIRLEEENNISYMSDLIQTDATINPGNSGGPLIYPNGEVIGINTVKVTSAEGIGFAIPINVVKPVIESFKNNDDFNQATIGVYAYDKDVIPYLDSNLSFEKGIYVAKIIENGPASRTELKEGDIITAINGIAINTMNELREYIYTKNPGEEVYLQINRKKINKEIQIILDKK